jgi:hypothetical protein
MLIAISVAVGTTAVAAADEPGVTTITITAKRPPTHATTAERVPPASTVEILTPMPTDMPEAEIDYHMPLIGVAPASAAARVPS